MFRFFFRKSINCYSTVVIWARAERAKARELFKDDIRRLVYLQFCYDRRRRLLLLATTTAAGAAAAATATTMTTTTTAAHTCTDTNTRTVSTNTTTTDTTTNYHHNCHYRYNCLLPLLLLQADRGHFLSSQDSTCSSTRLQVVGEGYLPTCCQRQLLCNFPETRLTRCWERKSTP